MSNVKLEVNNSLIKNLRYSFSNKTTVINELLQNAERSGSDEVHISTTSDTNSTLVEFRDFGEGISDMQKLLTLSESGWDEETTEQTRPWGMGFMSAIFASKKVIIESGYQRLVLDTEKVLEMEQMEVTTVTEPIQGTRITLELDYKLTKGMMEEIAQGFSVPVTFDKIKLQQGHKLTEGIHLPGVGTMLDTGLDNLCEGYTGSYTYYHSGFQVMKDRYRRNHIVVHVDPKLWTARQPDRDTVINSKEMESEAKRQLHDYLVEQLKLEKEKDPIAFAKTFWKPCKTLGLRHLFNDIPYLPAGTFTEVEYFPELSIDGYTSRISSISGYSKYGLSKAEVDGCTIFFPQDIDSCTQEEDIALYQLAYHTGNHILVARDNFDAGHWIQSTDYDKYEEVEYKVEEGGDSHSIPSQTSYVTEVIQHKEEMFSIRVNDEYTIETDMFYDTDEGVIHVGRKVKCIKPLLRLQDSYYNEDIGSWDDHWMQEDNDIFCKEASGWHASPKELLASKIESLKDYKRLHGKKFILTIDNDGNINIG